MGVNRKLFPGYDQYIREEEFLDQYEKAKDSPECEGKDMEHVIATAKAFKEKNQEGDFNIIDACKSSPKEDN